MQLTERQIKLLHNTFIDYHATSEFLQHPLVIERAKGLYYWDTEGKRYFDAIGGIFVAVLGHGHPRVMQAMRDQMDKVTFAPPLHSITNVPLDFVERLGEGEVEEMIIATNPTVEGEATAHYIGQLARAAGIRATRLAHGVPLGGELEFVDRGTLAHAFGSRQSLG